MTAKEFLLGNICYEDVTDLMIGFARLKVREALEAAAAEKVTIIYDKDPRHPSGWFESINKDSILNAYDLNNIE